MTPNDYLSALLDAIERHTQATQAHTAAINSLLGKRLPADSAATPTPDGAAELLERQVIEGQLDSIDFDVETLQSSLERLTDRLELLRQSLTIDQPREAPAHENTGPAITPAV